MSTHQDGQYSVAGEQNGHATGHQSEFTQSTGEPNADHLRPLGPIANAPTESDQNAAYAVDAEDPALYFPVRSRPSASSKGFVLLSSSKAIGGPNVHRNQVFKYTSLELFAGAGGLALGIHDAGFRPRALVEWDDFAADTLRDNSKRLLDLDPALVHNCDARAVNYEQFSGRVDLLSGGPPCQPFSTGGVSRGSGDDRNMFPIFIEAVGVVRPRAVLIENVKGLLRSKFADYVTYLMKWLEFPLLAPRPGERWSDHYQRLLSADRSNFALDEQYEVDKQLIDTADFGVPQRRERVIFTAFRRDLGIPPVRLNPTHSKEALLVSQYITGEYWDRHGIVPRRDHLVGRDAKIIASLQQSDLFGADKRKLEPWRTVRDAISDLPEPAPRGAEDRAPMANHVQHPGARIYPCHVGSFYDYPAKALKAGTHGTPGGENILRRSESETDVRYFTTREAARLQTFPDAWRFHGTWGACIKQLGNAVPRDLAYQFASEIGRRLDVVQIRAAAEEEANAHQVVG